MTTRLASALALLALLQTTPAFAAAAKPTDRKAVAERVVSSAAVKASEVVVIDGYVADADFLEDLALAVRKVGGLPVVMMQTPGFQKRWFQESPAAHDASAFDHLSRLYDVANVIIHFTDYWTPDTVEVTPERITARDASEVRASAHRVKKNVRMVELGNGLFPSDKNAKQLGLSKAELDKMFWSGLATDPATLKAAGTALRSALQPAKELRITTPKGTDFKVQIDSRPLSFTTGVLTPEDLTTGGFATQLYLPAGEAWLTPVPETAEGKVVIGRLNYEGGAIEDMELTFAAGKVTSVKAKPGKLWDVWKSRWDAAPECKTEFAVVDFGFNPDLKPKGKQPLLNFVVPGMVQLAIGNNAWAEGGLQKCSYSQQWYQPSATVTADGITIVDKGELRVTTK